MDDSAPTPTPQHPLLSGIEMSLGPEFQFLFIQGLETSKNPQLLSPWCLRLHKLIGKAYSVLPFSRISVCQAPLSWKLSAAAPRVRLKFCGASAPSRLLDLMPCAQFIPWSKPSADHAGFHPALVPPPFQLMSRVFCLSGF